MKNKKELINLYVDGELNSMDAEKVEKMIAKDANLQQYFENITRLNSLLGSVYELPKSKPYNEHIATKSPSKKSTILLKLSNVNWIQTTAIAASVAAVMTINNYMFNTNNIDLSIIEKHITMTRYDALENKLSNHSASWSDKSKKVSVVVTPIKTYKTTSGDFCREYKEIINNSGEVISRNGVACRKEKGNWPNRYALDDFYNQG